MLEDRSFAAVLFDLDGTLISSIEAGLRCWSQWAEEEGVDIALLEGGHGVPAAQLIARVLEPERVAAAARRVTELELADTAGVRPLPGAHDALAALPAGRAAIVTSCTPDLYAVRFAATGLPEPSVVVTAADVAVGKPDPAPFLLAASRIGADPGDCLVVEDAPAGLAAGRAAGCATLGVDGQHPDVTLDADLVVGDLSGVRFATDAGGIRVRAQVR